MSELKVLMSRREFLDPPGTSNPDYVVVECVEYGGYPGTSHVSVELSYRGQEVYLPFSVDADRARSLHKLYVLIETLVELRTVLRGVKAERDARVATGSWIGSQTQTQTRLGGA
jgi:hypothetical protein